MRRPRIKRTTEQIETPDGDVYLLRPSADNDIQIEKPDEKERRLLAALDGEHTLEQLHEEFGAETVDDVLAQLERAGGGRGRRGRRAAAARRARALRPPAALLQRHRRRPDRRRECQERLREAKIAVLGVGGLGGWSRLGARLHRRRRDVADRRRRGRDQQPQPPDPLHRGRHRPAQGRVRGGATARLQLGDDGSRPRRAASRARTTSPSSSPAPTSSSTPPTGPRTTSSAGATRPASRPASRTSR